MKVKELIELLSELENQEAEIGLFPRIYNALAEHAIWPLDGDKPIVVNGRDCWTGEPEAYYLQTIRHYCE